MCAAPIFEENYFVVYQRTVRLSACQKKILVSADLTDHELIGCAHRFGTRQRDSAVHLHAVLI